MQPTLEAQPALVEEPIQGDRVDVAWLRYSNEAAQGAIAGWHKPWLFPHPGSKTLSAPQALASAAKLADVSEVPVFRPDSQRGQARLDPGVVGLRRPTMTRAIMSGETAS
ncbi:MAG: hypothetical protein IPI67_23585 [Myxococcales bacterium]|nr:hypothetical protein [Myxococcales bacterium]